MATEPLRLPLRECVPCRLWTECGVCPTCFERLGPPPFASPVLPGQLDFAEEVPLGEGPGTCSHCRLTAPFHTAAGCPGGAAGRPFAPSTSPPSTFPQGGEGSSKSSPRKESSHA